MREREREREREGEGKERRGDEKEDLRILIAVVEENETSADGSFTLSNSHPGTTAINMTNHQRK